MESAEHQIHYTLDRKEQIRLAKRLAPTNFLLIIVLLLPIFQLLIAIDGHLSSIPALAVAELTVIVYLISIEYSLRRYAVEQVDWSFTLSKDRLFVESLRNGQPRMRIWITAADVRNLSIRKGLLSFSARGGRLLIPLEKIPEGSPFTAWLTDASAANASRTPPRRSPSPRRAGGSAAGRLPTGLRIACSLFMAGTILCGVAAILLFDLLAEWQATRPSYLFLTVALSLLPTSSIVAGILSNRRGVLNLRNIIGGIVVLLLIVACSATGAFLG